MVSAARMKRMGGARAPLGLLDRDTHGTSAPGRPLHGGGGERTRPRSRWWWTPWAGTRQLLTPPGAREDGWMQGHATIGHSQTYQSGRRRRAGNDHGTRATPITIVADSEFNFGSRSRGVDSRVRPGSQLALFHAKQVRSRTERRMFHAETFACSPGAYGAAATAPPGLKYGFRWPVHALGRPSQVIASSSWRIMHRLSATTRLRSVRYAGPPLIVRSVSRETLGGPRGLWTAT